MAFELSNVLYAAATQNSVRSVMFGVVFNTDVPGESSEHSIYRVRKFATQLVLHEYAKEDFAPDRRAVNKITITFYKTNGDIAYIENYGVWFENSIYDASWETVDTYLEYVHTFKIMDQKVINTNSTTKGTES